jgi:hypothetical protein
VPSTVSWIMNGKPVCLVRRLGRRMRRGDTYLQIDEDVHFEWRGLRERCIHEMLLIYDNIQDCISNEL